MKNSLSIRRMAQASVMAAILAVLSQIAIPLPAGVPLTLQTLAVALCGFISVPALSARTLLVYVLLGAIGLPVFAEFSGGPGVLVGMTGGFVWGFFPFAALCGLGMRQKSIFLRAVFALLGLSACHIPGILQFSLVTGNGLPASFAAASLPYLAKDVLSLTGAYFIARPIRRALKHAGL